MKVEDQLKQMERDLRGLAIGLVADDESVQATIMAVQALETIQKLRWHFAHNWVGEHEQFPAAAEPS